MVSRFQIKSYLTYWLDAVDDHSLHSPFFFDLYRTVIRKDIAGDFDTIEKLRSKLLNNRTPLLINDPGAGSQQLKSRERLISDIARTSLSPVKYSRVYFNIISRFKFQNVLELGTSLGINALYLASPHGSQVTTFEGVPSIASVARSTFEFANAKNINLIEGDIAKTLPSFLERTTPIDFAFIDANHRYEPTVKYFTEILRRTHLQSVIVIDDTHYTPEMEKAWNEIKSHPLVYGTADLYRCGIVFFDPSLNKQHVVLQF